MCSFSIVMWKLDSKEGWVPENWCFWIVVLDKTLESPFASKIKPVSPKGNQPWIFIGSTDAEAEAPNTLATWFKVLTHWKRPWCWERRKAKGEGGSSGWLLDSITSSMDMSLNKLLEKVDKEESGMLQSVESQRVRHDLVTEQQHNIKRMNYCPLQQSGQI